MNVPVLRILLVEDSPDDRAVVRAALRAGHPGRVEIRQADSGEEALAEVRGGLLPDCALLDVNLPGMDGIETLRALRGQAAGLPFPVVVLTASAQDDYARQALREGAHDFVSKSGLTSDLLARSIANSQERFRLEEALRERERRLALALQIATLGWWSWEPASGTASWSPEFEALFGLPSGGLGHDLDAFLDRVHPPDRERVRETVTSGTSYNLEFQFTHADGSLRWMLGRGAVELGPDGAVSRVNHIGADISARKRVEQEKQEQEALSHRLLESSSDCIKLLSPEGRLLLVNPPGLSMLEIDDFEAIRGRYWPEVWSENRAEVEEAVRQAAGGRSYRFQGFCPTFLGKAKWWDVEVNPVRDAEGSVSHLVAISRDITELRQAEVALREADQRKDDFIAMLGHELRNPLGAMRNAVHAARMHGAPAPVAQNLDVVDRQMSHMAHLVDDLLDVSRITRGKIDLKMAPEDLTALVRRCAEDHRPLVETGGLRLLLRLPNVPLWVRGDSVRLCQIVGNLLTNAAKFTPAGQITLDLRPSPAGEAVLTVRDTGIGVDPELLPQLFGPFVQATQGLARTSGGLGLGLALVRGLARLHGGTASARSEGSGRGAEFVVTLPLADAPETPPEPSAAPDAENGRLRVLLVEDNQDAADTLAEILKFSGHDVCSAYDGAEGLELARRFRPHLILCDLGLPRMDGYAVARALRADPAIQSIRLVAMTGYGRPEDVERCLAAGFDAHLMKPINFDDLEALLRTVR